MKKILLFTALILICAENVRSQDLSTKRKIFVQEIEERISSIDKLKSNARKIYELRKLAREVSYKPNSPQKNQLVTKINEKETQVRNRTRDRSSPIRTGENSGRGTSQFLTNIARRQDMEKLR